MVATLEVHVETLSHRPRWRRKKEFVVGDRYEETARIVNDNDWAFPPRPMTIDILWDFASRRRQGRRIGLPAKSVDPHGTFELGTITHKVLDSGFAFLLVHYDPHDQGCVLHDAQGMEIVPGIPRSVGDFLGVSRAELASRGRLTVAIVGLWLAAVALLLNILL